MWEDMRKQADFSTKLTFTNDQKGQLIWKSCFTTGASKGPTGVNAPVVIQLKNALIVSAFADTTNAQTVPKNCYIYI
jgi:hypothetical protein